MSHRECGRVESVQSGKDNDGRDFYTVGLTINFCGSTQGFGYLSYVS